MSIISPHYRSIRELLQGQSFSIDEYQREYKWEEKHIVELISDLLTKFQSAYLPGDETKSVNNYEGYFLGSIIVSKREGKSYLIDGQQRLTSLTLLLIHLFRESQAKDLKLDALLAPLIFSDNYGTPNFNLDIPERLPVIEALFSGEKFTPDGKAESIQTMLARYGDIEAQQISDELEAALPHFIYWLLNRVGLIEIATDNDNFAYSIFETMNDRGKPLSPVDMLKAYLLAPISDKDLKALANTTWKNEVLSLITFESIHDAERDSSCIKAWFRAQYANSIRERKAGASDKDWELIGTVFHRWARDNASRLSWGKDSNNNKIIQTEFPFFAKAYKLILKAGLQYETGLEAIFYNAHNEFTWQNTVLLASLISTDGDEIVRRKLAIVATYLDIWIMRRAVNYVRVTYASSGYAMYLLCNAVRGKPIPELIAILKARLDDDDITFDGIPSKKDSLGIPDLRLSQFSRRYVYHLLARVTSYIEVNSDRPDLFKDYVNRERNNPSDIEHIWENNFPAYKTEFASEDEFNRVRDHVASLLLLPADVNRSYQDKPFTQKVDCYATQNLYAASLSKATYDHQPRFIAFNQTLSNPLKWYKKFGKNEHKERTLQLETLVKAVWSPERLDTAGL